MTRDPNTAQSERQTPDATEAPPARDFMKPAAPTPGERRDPEREERRMTLEDREQLRRDIYSAPFQPDSIWGVAAALLGENERLTATVERLRGALRGLVMKAKQVTQADREAVGKRTLALDLAIGRMQLEALKAEDALSEDSRP